MSVLKYIWHIGWFNFHGGKMDRFIKIKKPWKCTEYHYELMQWHYDKSQTIYNKWGKKDGLN